MLKNLLFIPRRNMSLKFSEITGDLFSAPEEFSLAHCVASDLKMGKGIAIKFRDTFGRVDVLKSQNPKTGGMIFLKDKNRYIYYLITKQLTSHYPTYETMENSLKAMKDHMVANQVKKLAIPKIGCGLDRLKWEKVSDQIMQIFGDMDAEIVVYNYSAKR